MPIISRGQTSVIAIHGGYDTFVYPAYGANLSRRVLFLHAPDPTPVAIPDEARWVVVDRPWNCFFGNPNFKDFGSWHTLIGAGAPSAEDRRVFEQLEKDKRFKLIWSDLRLNQAVFRRMD